MIIPLSVKILLNILKHYELNKSLALENMSMGMSADYLDAIKHGSNLLELKFYIWFSILTAVFRFNFLKFSKDKFFNPMHPQFSRSFLP